MPNNNIPIPTDTKVYSIKVDSSLKKTIKDLCDKQGAVGRFLSSTFMKDDKNVVLIFQRTR